MARSDNEEISSSVSQYIYKWRQIKVDINGDDLHRLGLEPGPQFGRGGFREGIFRDQFPVSVHVTG